jgi:multidrug resistance protein MdtO
MALLAAEKLEQDAREFAARIFRLLAPAPGRLEFAARIAAVCVLTTLVAETYGTPDPALTVYVAFFMIRPDRASSVITDLVFMVIITVVIGLIFLIAIVVADEASLRVASIALVSFGLLFLASASKFKEVGPIAALIVGYGLDLLGSIPAGEAATRGYLYAWLFVGIPACVSIIWNILFGPSPVSVVRRTLSSRMRTAARALIKPDGKDAEVLRRCLREGNGELLQQLRLAALEHASPAQDRNALGRATNASVAVLSSIDFTLHAHDAMLPRRLRARLARTLNRIAIVIGRGSYPADIELPAHEEMPAAAGAAYAEIAGALAAFTDTSPSAAHGAPKEKLGFFVADAFSNSIHVYYALKTTIAAMFCYFLYSVLDWPGIHTCFITCYIVSLKTVAETVEKLTLRVSGAMLGAGLGLLTIIFIVPTHDSITDLVVIVFVAGLAAGWIAAGSPHISYVGFQFAFAFFLCVIQGAAPSEQLSVARDRVVGIMLGDFVAFVVHTQLWPVSLKSRIESGIADVLRALADFARASDRTDRRTLAANAQAELGALEDNIALIAYEPPSIQPTRRWLDLRGRIAGLLGRLAPALLIESEQADTTDIARHLSAMAQNEVPRQSMHALPGPVEAIVHDRIRALEIAMKEEALAQS